ncbi:hypothetical protein GCM10011282_15580 [Undibacterium macrobrachii]|uniref:Uncharacterized protein n=1 Tax=Undibacterium macrobrachii TaxID=1119058 RepID=A0ABQ2XE59_9BURK|nr:hypothetical protein GCM10011282_15580 [Undibacterium macrobrachii]
MQIVINASFASQNDDEYRAKSVERVQILLHLLRKNTIARGHFICIWQIILFVRIDKINVRAML